MLNAGYTQHMLIDACILYCGKYCTIPECDPDDAVTFDKKNLCNKNSICHKLFI